MGSFYEDFQKKKNKNKAQNARASFTSGALPTAQQNNKAAAPTQKAQKPNAAASSRNTQSTVKSTNSAPSARSSFTSGTLPTLPSGYKAPAPTVKSAKPTAAAQKPQSTAQPLMTQLQINSQKWHTTSDPAQKARLHQQNNEIRKRLGLGYANGVTYGKDGRNLSLGAQMLHSQKAASARHFSDAMQSKEFNSNDTMTARPSLYQAVQGVTVDDLAGQTGANAHKAMRDLFNRADETWSRQDTQIRDRARQELTNEMSRIFEHFGLKYVPRNGDSATVMRQLRAAGADNNTLAYVQENINLRDAADRLGESMEAVGKRWAASIPSLVDTARQTSANVEESRQSEEYRQLEEREQQLELQLQGMNSTAADGSVPADYQAVYDQLQTVKERKNQLTINKGVDPNKWSQKMLREANEAQRNAEAGLSAAPRWLTEQGISLAGNAPMMAASAIPVVGPAVGSAVIGAQAAGQRAFELNERGVPARESLVRGATSGIIEAATERLPLEQMANILHSGGTGAVRSILRQMGVEAGEESASYFLNFVADKAAADPDAKFSLAELVQSAAGGAFGGLVFGTAGALGAHMADEGATRAAQAYSGVSLEQSFADNMVKYDAELRAAQSLPEGPAREAAVQTARDNLTQTLSDFLSQRVAQQAETAAQNGAFDQMQTVPPVQQTAEQTAVPSPAVQESVPVQELMQYGKTPEQAAMEAQAKQQSAIEQQRQAEISELTNRLRNAWTEITEIEQGTHNAPYAEQETAENARYYQLREEINQLNTALEERGVDTERILPERRSSTPRLNAGNIDTFPNVVQIRLNDKATKHEPRIAQDGSEGPAPIVPTPIKPGDKIRTWSRNNLGYALEGRGAEGDVSAWFANDTTTGRKGVHFVEADDAMKIADRADYEVANEQQRAAAAEEALSPSLDDSGYRKTAQAWAESVPNPLGEFQQHGKSAEQAMQELQSKLRENRSFLYDSDTKHVRAVQSAELREAWELARPIQEQMEQFRKRNPLSERDESYLQAALVNGATDSFNQCDDPDAVLHLFQMQKELNRRMEPVREFQRARSDAIAMNAEEMADTIAEFAKDKKISGAYSRETMERNNLDIFEEKNRAYAEHLNDEYFTPVHKAVADKTNYVNTMREQVAALKLTAQESALVQMALEGRNDVAAEYMKNNNIKVTKELQKHVADGVATFQAIYKELYEAINETLLSNGMEPIRARKNYAPHFVKDKPDTVLSRVLYSFGLSKDSTLNLPTDLAGITDDFSPGKKWFGNLLQREGELTDYDAVAGFDRYIETAGNVIFLTDSVQNLRALENALRYRLSDEGTREKANQIRNDRSLNALERHQQIQAAYDTNAGDIQKLYNQKKQGMGGYVSNLHEYINNLAGKKARADRGWEELIGRQMYNVAKNVEGRVAANMIALNPGSWITNFIPITQATGEVSVPNLIRAMRDTVQSAVKDDGFPDGSVFLTNREGTQMLDRTLTRRISDLAGMPMEAIDHFTANVVTRGKYLQNIQDGMDMMEAFDNADSFAANLMADRSEGAQPTAFNSVNPIRKVFTMFQLEVNNQLSYLFKDLPRAKQSVPKLAWAYTKIFTGAYLFNAVYHQLTGRDSAFDPISMIADAFGIGDDDDEDKSKVDIALDLGENVAEQLPFIGGVLGGGRVPISAAFPDFGKLKEEYQNGYDSKRIALDAGKGLAGSAAYLLLPFGGGALKKAVEGAATLNAGGSYSLDKNGEKILQFPVYGQSPADWAQAMLFGKSSLQEAQSWAENGYDSLNAKETKAFDELRRRMSSWSGGKDNSEEVYAAIKAMRSITDSAREKYPDCYTDVAAKQNREMLMNNTALSEMQKNYLDRELIGSEVGNSGDYSSREAFDISQNVRKARRDDALEAVKHGISVDDFAAWDDVLVTLGDEDNDGGEAMYTTNEKLGAILEQINQTEGYTDGMKQALADYVLISAMSKTDREKWTDEVQGKVNASDYVRFKSDVAAFEKMAKGSGTDYTAGAAEILNGYTNLTDTQREVLLNSYKDNAANNIYHISEYEQAISNTAFYGYLSDNGKKELRSMLNSYEQNVADGKELQKWQAKAYMAQEAGISPGIYALYYIACEAADTDDKGISQAKAEAAANSIDGLTREQKAYLWQSTNKSWKKNPFGSATVSEYTSSSESIINPVEGGVVPDGGRFGPRQSFMTNSGQMSSKWHPSLDISAPAGTPIKSIMSGKVTKNGWVDGYGWTIEVTHTNGMVSMYHHMNAQSGVAVGTEVTQGQQIGNVGQTGNSTGPHLDLTITKDGKPIDPATVISEFKDKKTGYVYEGSPVYTQLSSAAATSSSSKSRKSSGGSSGSSGMKTLDKPKNLKGLW